MRENPKGPVRLVLTAIVVAIACAVACKSSSTQPSGAAPADLATFVAGVQTVGASAFQAAQRSGQPPAANGGPPVTVSGPATAVSGGGGAYGLTTTTPIRKILVSLSDGGRAVDGFFELELPSDVTGQSVLLSYGTSIPRSSFTTKFQVVTASGLVGQTSAFETVVQTGSQITGAMVLTFAPDPAPYLNGVACTLFPGRACGYEFTITVKELNGVAVSLTSAAQSFDVPGSGGPRAPTFQPTSVPAHGSVNVFSGVMCVAGDSFCTFSFGNPNNFNQQSTFFLSLFGTDTNGHQVSGSSSVQILAR